MKNTQTKKKHSKSNWISVPTA